MSLMSTSRACHGGDVGFVGAGSGGVTDGQTDCICEEGKQNEQKTKPAWCHEAHTCQAQGLPQGPPVLPGIN